MNPYELLGIEKTATAAQVKAGYKKAVKSCHPDKGGDVEKFRQVQQAFEVLNDPVRRERYDKTGRTDLSPVTPAAVKSWFDQMVRAMVEAEAKDGSTDNPVMENIREKVLLTLQKSRVEIKDNKHKAWKRLSRATQLLERFKPMAGYDPIGEALKDNVARIRSDMTQLDDMLELSQEIERVVKTYNYEVGPRPEGQYNPEPTTRRSGVRYIS